MFSPPVVLHEYLPNHARSGRYTYDGSHLTRFEEPTDLFGGYAVPFLHFSMKRKVAVFFAADAKLFMDLGSGPTELIPQPASVSGMAFWRKVHVQTASGPVVIDVFTPPFRYLGNDGMFPEDIEPMVHLLKALTHMQDREKFIRKFTTGSWE